MLHRLRSRLSSAHVIALIALFVALGGTGYAAVKLPKNSVGAAQIKTGGVGSSEVKNGSLRKSDFKQTDLPQGPQGPQGAPGQAGAKGDTGEPGSAAAFARVQPTGVILPPVGDFPATAKGITDANITHPETGVYCIDLGFRPAAAMVALDNAGANDPPSNAFSVSVATERGNNINPCTGTDARVRTTNWTDATAPTAADHGFVIWFEEG